MAHVKENITINSKCSHIESTAHIGEKINFGIRKYLKDIKNFSDDADVNQLDRIFEKTIENCMQFFH